MSRDYKSRASARSKARQCPPGWIWFLGGLLVGLFFSGLAWLKLMPPPDETAVRPPPVQPANPVLETAPEPAAPRPRFDFYTILPEMEVVVPEPEPLPTVPAARPEPRPQKQSGEKYMLQMGSFRKFADADRLKASLALVGIVAEIQKVNIKRGEIFYRVRSGPYGRDKVNALRERLKKNSINSLVIKLKQ